MTPANKHIAPELHRAARDSVDVPGAPSNASLDLAARAARCREVVAVKPPVVDLPLIRTFALDDSEVEDLKLAALVYLWQCARIAGFRLRPPTDARWFFENACILRSLPNVTPNGLVLSKRETIASYNFLHQTVAQIMGLYFNEREVAAIHAPINVRLVDGHPDPMIDSRPRSAVKIHSDIWAAEPSHSLAVFLPIVGDVEETSVEFMEPAEFPPEFHRPLNDFALGAAAIPVARVYPFVFMKNHLITMDSLCLHRTIKSGARARLSLDFRVLYKHLLPSDIYRDSPRLSNYVPPPIWYGVGNSYMVVSRSSIHDEVADFTANAYASRYDISGM